MTDADLVRYVADPNRLGAVVEVAVMDKVYVYGSFFEAFTDWGHDLEVKQALEAKEAEWMVGLGLEPW